MKYTLKVAEKLSAVTLAGVPGKLLPAQAVGDNLLKEGAEQKVTSPFTFADLRKYLPAWALKGEPLGEEKAVDPTDVVAAVANALKPKPSQQPLSLVQWCAAFTRWAFAAVAAGLARSVCPCALGRPPRAKSKN